MTTKKINIELTNLNIMLSYNYKNSDITNHMCQICKKHIMAPTVDAKNSRDLNCNITEGKCKHLFHSSCIDNYIKAGNIICPIDMTPWNVNHIIDNSDTYKKLIQSDIQKIKAPSVTCICNNKK